MIGKPSREEDIPRRPPIDNGCGEYVTWDSQGMYFCGYDDITHARCLKKVAT